MWGPRAPVLACSLDPGVWTHSRGVGSDLALRLATSLTTSLNQWPY